MRFAMAYALISCSAETWANSTPMACQLISEDTGFVGSATPISPRYAIATCHQLRGNHGSCLKLLQNNIYRKAKIVRKFPYIDVTLLEVDDAFNSYFRLVSTLDIQKGKKCYASGYNPTISCSPLTTAGIIMGTSTEDLSNILPVSCRVFLSDTRTNSGFSGGPLFSCKNELFGIIAGRIFPIPDEASIGAYIIPSFYIQRFLRLDPTEHALNEIKGKIIKETGSSSVLFYVEQDSNLILENETLIVEIDGIRFNTINEFNLMLSTMKRGESYFTVLDKGKFIKIKFK